MRKIKFRGRDLSGKMRYGFYAEDNGYPYIIENHTWHEVDPDTENEPDLELQAHFLHDKISRDARLGFSKSVFDLLPDISELRDVD